MASDELQVALTTVDANRLRKWGSAWFDLIQSGQALEARRNTPASLTTAFIRRAFWESAVISYFRVGQGDKRRKIDLEALFAATGDPGVSDFHNEILEWRHDHVAHRGGRRFEDVHAVICYDAQPDVRALRLLIETSIGPSDDDELVEQFREHVLLLRNTMWESFLAPLAEKLVIVAQHDTELRDSAIAAASNSANDRIAADLVLWARENGTGIASQGS
ncbi:hypothetical protein ACFYTQ_37520 [Nocardia sp. NPDC004068]|uniref:hypothetical protein n=1 Tax=Nocardia sp. NPDC004068 TaxID=3364303 RepID=UPI003695FEAE